MKLLEDRYPNNRVSLKADQRLQQFTAQDMTDFAKYISHLIVNDAICSSNRIRVKSSNNCAEFVDKWFKEKQV